MERVVRDSRAAGLSGDGDRHSPPARRVHKRVLIRVQDAPVEAREGGLGGGGAVEEDGEGGVGGEQAGLDGEGLGGDGDEHGAGGALVEGHVAFEQHFGL